MQLKRMALVLGLFAVGVVLGRGVWRLPAAPYAASPVLAGLEIDWKTHIRLAPGSDNWPLTWAADDNQYAAWGDGGGFDGTNAAGRTSLGVALISGPAHAYRGKNIWGGAEPESGAAFSATGKSYGILCLDGTLYLWVSYDDTYKCMFDMQLYYSRDYGSSWQQAEWRFPKELGFMTPTFLQFGKDYSGARDEYVYVYATHVENDAKLEVQKPGSILLLRVPARLILERPAYEVFSGFDQRQRPVWQSDLSRWKSVFSDKNGVGWCCAVSYNAGLNRYLLSTEHTRTFQGRLGVFDAPEPWGPWTTVEYFQSFGVPQVERTVFFANFSNKWAEASDGRFVLIFTGINSNDAWNSVDGRFIPR